MHETRQHTQQRPRQWKVRVGKGNETMQTSIEYIGRDRYRERMREIERRARERSVPNESRRSVRQSLGLSLISVGQRLAADNVRTPVLER